MKTKQKQISGDVLVSLLRSAKRLNLALLLLFFAPFVELVDALWLIATAALSVVLKVR